MSDNSPDTVLGPGIPCARDEQLTAPSQWPPRPSAFGDLMRPIEAAQYRRLDELDAQPPAKALRTLRYWRDRGQLRATKYARHVWFRRAELDRFLETKTEK